MTICARKHSSHDRTCDIMELQKSEKEKRSTCYDNKYKEWITTIKLSNQTCSHTTWNLHAYFLIILMHIKHTCLRRSKARPCLKSVDTVHTLPNFFPCWYDKDSIQGTRHTVVYIKDENTTCTEHRPAALIYIWGCMVHIEFLCANTLYTNKLA